MLGRRPEPLRYGDGDAADPCEAPGIIRSLMPEGVRVLDVGCGAGGQTVAINRGKHNDVLCVEPDELRNAAARAKGLTVHQGSFDATFPRAFGTFDVIIFADVLEHLVDPSAALRLAQGCLNPGGTLFVSVPNVAHWTVRLRLLMGKFDYQDGGIMDATHLRWFTRSSLIALLQNEGFAVTSIAGTAGLWMSEYQRLPFRLVPPKIRRLIVRVLLRFFPRLMACQHVVESRPVDIVRSA
jgi:2-polyprenyl-3-methyl-5-hydroxy-6-metoxy-1,4-benzoquinol methylase